LALALAGALGCGQLIPWTLGIRDPALDAGMTLVVALAAFVSNLVLARALVPEPVASSPRRMLVEALLVTAVLAATLTVATSASTRLPSLMTIEEQATRVIAGSAAFVTVLVTMQVAALRALRDFATTATALRVRLPARTAAEPSPAVALPGSVPVPAGVELLGKQPVS
jgi:hypothetical protein